MRVRRVRVDGLREGAVRLRGDEAHHLARVLRVRPGDPVQAFDGRGCEADGEVARVGDGAVELRLAAPTASAREAPLELVLVVALLKGDKLAQVVRQGTELGVARFALATSRRADVPRLSPAKEERLRRVAREAAKQSGRARVPAIDEPVPLPRLSWSGPAWVAHPDAEVHLASVGEALAAAPPQHLTIVTGPEGGFDDAELATLRERGARPVRIGPRVLRAETAPVALAAAVLARFEE